VRDHNPILFLDIDGVMNTLDGMASNKSNAVFTVSAVAGLRRIVCDTDCAIVISSTWREDRMGNLKDALISHGLGVVVERIIGFTPLLSPNDHPTRTDEIGCWLHHFGHQGRIAILDDEPLFGELTPWHVCIRDSVGLNEAGALWAVRLLTTGVPFGK
jgi:hypothetical protein